MLSDVCRFPWRLPASCFFHLSLKSFWLGPLKIVDSLVHVFLFFFFKFAGNTFSRAVLFELEHAKNYLESWWNHKFLEPVLGWPWCHWAKVHTGLYKNWCWASMAVQCLKTLPSHAGGVGFTKNLVTLSQTLKCWPLSFYKLFKSHGENRGSLSW